MVGSLTGTRESVSSSEAGTIEKVEPLPGQSRWVLVTIVDKDGQRHRIKVRRGSVRSNA